MISFERRQPTSRTFPWIICSTLGHLVMNTIKGAKSNSKRSTSHVKRTGDEHILDLFVNGIVLKAFSEKKRIFKTNAKHTASSIAIVVPF